MNLLDYIPIVQDFPKPGVAFRDVSPLLANPAAFSKALDLLNDQFAQTDYDVIAGIDSRGFIFGTALARLTGKPFVMIRKANKLPHEVGMHPRNKPFAPRWRPLFGLQENGLADESWGQFIRPERDETRLSA